MFALIERLIFFIVVISTIRAIILSVQRFWSGVHPRSATTPEARAADPRTRPQTTTLHQDPVCGTYVAVDASLKRIVNGEVVHFCSAECRDRYPA